jgi:outer membrane PBP1 activator LpoA protein
MGFDAHRLVPILYGQPAQLTAIPAMSGELSLDAEGRVRRRLPVAQFRNGVPVALGVGEDPQQEEPPAESSELAELR